MASTKNKNAGQKRSGQSRDQYDSAVRSSYSARTAADTGKKAQSKTANNHAGQKRSGLNRDQYDSAVRSSYSARAAADSAKNKVSEQEFNRSASMQSSYGSYQNYLQGRKVTAGGFYSKPTPTPETIRAMNTTDAMVQAINKNQETYRLAEFGKRANIEPERAISIMQKAQTEHEKLYARYLEAKAKSEPLYEAFKKDEEQWRQTIRGKDAVAADVERLNQMIASLQNREAQLLQTETQIRGRAKQMLTAGRQTAESFAQAKQIEKDADNAKAQADAVTNQIRSLREQLALVEEEQWWDFYYRYEKYKSDPDFALKSQYVSEPTGVVPTIAEQMMGYGGEKKWKNLLYEWVNGNEDAGAILRQKAANDYAGDEIGRYFAQAAENGAEATMMTDDERAMYNYLYHARGFVASKKYFEELKSLSLNTRLRQDMEQYIGQQVAEHGAWGKIAGSAYSVPANLMSVLSTAAQVADYAADGEMVKDAPYNKFNDSVSTIRDEVSKDWHPAARMAYQTGMSIADFAFNALITGGFSVGTEATAASNFTRESAKKLSMAIMATEVAAPTVMEAKDRGLSDGQAMILGVVAAAAEILTEKFSIDTLLDSLGSNKGIAYILKNMGAEGSEEMASDLINLVADVVVARDQSEWRMAIEAGKAQGLSEQEAFAQAFAAEAINIGLSGLGGVVSGGVMGGGYMAYSKGVENKYYNEGMKKIGQGLVTEEGRAELLETVKAGLQLEKDNPAYKQAKAINDKIEKGKKISALEAGRMYTAVSAAEEAQLREQAEKGTENAQPSDPRMENGTENARTAGTVTVGTPTKVSGDYVAVKYTPREVTQGMTEQEASGARWGVQEETVKRVGDVSRLLGVNVVWYREGPENGQIKDGYYNRETGKIYLNADTPNPTMQIISHELTHALEGTRSYGDFYRLVLGEMTDLDTQVQDKIAAYASAGITLNSDGAKKEIVAHYVQTTLLTDEQAIRSIVRKNTGFGRWMMNSIDKLLAKLGNKHAKERLKLHRASDLYAKALREFQKEAKYLEATDGRLVLQKAEYTAEDAERARRDLDEAFERGEITEEELTKALDEIDSALEESEGRAAALAERTQHSVSEDGRLRLPKVENSDGYTETIQYSISRTRHMSWEKQVEGYIKKNGTIRSSDALYLGESEAFLPDEVPPAPLYIPLSVVNKGQRMKKNNSRSAHELTDQDLYDLQKNIKEAPAVIYNPDRKSIVYLTDGKNKKGCYIIAAFAVNENLHGENAHRATSIHGRESIPFLLKGLPGNAKIYVKNENKFSIIADLQSSITPELLAKTELVSDSLTQQNQTVNRQHSISSIEDGKLHLPKVETVEETARDTASGETDGRLRLPMVEKPIVEGGGTPIEELAEQRRIARRYRGSLPKDLLAKMDKVEWDLVNTMGKALGVPYFAGRNFMKAAAEVLSYEYYRTGETKQETVDGVLEAMYQGTVDRNRAYLEEYAEVRDWLKTTAITPRAEELKTLKRADIWKKKARGRLNLTKEGGISLDEAYERLKEMAPKIFPDASAEKKAERIVEVAVSFDIAEQSLNDHSGNFAEQHKEAERDALIGEIVAMWAKLPEANIYARNLAKVDPDETGKKVAGQLELPMLTEAADGEKGSAALNELTERKRIARRYRSSLPKGMRDEMDKAEWRFVNEVGKAIGVPFVANRNFLKNAAEVLSDEYVRYGNARPEIVSRVFDAVYQGGIDRNEEFLEQYRDAQKWLAENPEAESIAFGAYERLRKMAPELFPPEIETWEQRAEHIAEVRKGFATAEQNLKDHRGRRAKAHRQAEFEVFFNAAIRLKSEQPNDADYLPAPEPEPEPVPVQEDGALQLPKVETAEAEPFKREDIPGKALPEIKRAEWNLVNKLGEALGVPYLAKRDFLKKLVEETITSEFLRTGKVRRKTANQVFNAAYDQGIVQSRDFYDEYKPIKDYLRETKVTISEQDQADIADFKDWRKRAFGSLRIVNEGGLPVNSAYMELQEMAPSLFPMNITHPADQLQRMLEVAKSIKIVEESLQDHYGELTKEHKEAERKAFDNVLREYREDMEIAKRWMDDRQLRDEESQKMTQEMAPKTVEEALEIGEQQKKAKQQYERVNAKKLLTPEDQLIVGKLLRGEYLAKHIKGHVNEAGILAVYEARKVYEDLNKIWVKWRQVQRSKKDSIAAEAITPENIQFMKDKKAGILYARETMQRNNEDVMPPEVARKVNALFFDTIRKSEKKANEFKTAARERVKKMKLSRKVENGNLVSEAHAVQLYGEARANIEILENSNGTREKREGRTLQDWKDIETRLWLENPNLDRGKIEQAVKDFREIYDKLLELMNRVRVENGYEPVSYRKGYFPHFQAGGDGIMAQFAAAMGITMDVTALPTTINGLTYTFNPGITWFGNTMERLGFSTAYDAVEGFDKYIEGVSNVIFFTENIQMLRALERRIRYLCSDEGVQKQVDEILKSDKSEKEKETLIEEALEKGQYRLSNYTNNLHEYTNLLAGKKSELDRGIESMIGRRWYNLAKAWEKRIGANMVGANFGSALTNFIPLQQAGAQLPAGTIMKAMLETMKNMKDSDGIAERSAFIANRKGSDPIVKTWVEKASGKMSIPMEYIDSFVAETIVRAKYGQNIKAGMSEEAAMDDADAWAARIMAERSKGGMPTLFASTNPIVKMFTQFQLEVNNEFSMIFKDIPRANREKGLRVLAQILLKYIFGAYVFNEFYEFFVGRRPALDPLNIINETVGDFTGYEIPNLVRTGVDLLQGEKPDFTTQKKNAWESMGNLVTNAAGELPFSSALALVSDNVDGGRIPAASGVPNLVSIGSALADKEMDSRKKWNTIGKEAAKLAYVLPPFGGGQLAKMVKGVKALAQGGSYSVNREGEDILQYPVYRDSVGETILSAGQMALFGKSATREAQEWVDSGFQSLSAKETAVYQDLTENGMKERDAFAFVKSLQGEEEKRQAIIDSNVSEEAKVIAFYGLLATKEEKALLDSLDRQGFDGVACAGAMLKASVSETKEDKLEAMARRDLEPEAYIAVADKVGLLTSDKQIETMKALAESGQDMQQSAELLVKIVGAEKRTDELALIRDADLDREAFEEYAAFIIGSKERETETGNRTQFAKLMDAVDGGLDRSTAVQMQIDGHDLEKVISLMEEGMKPATAANVIRDVGELEPEEGYDDVQAAQKWRACVDAASNPKDQLEALRVIMNESQFEKVESAYNDYGIAPEAFVRLKERLPEFDEDGNGSFKQAEVTAAMAAIFPINVLPGGGSLSNEQKAALWQLWTGSKSAKNNPYSRAVGQQVIDARNAAKEAEEAEEEEEKDYRLRLPR